MKRDLYRHLKTGGVYRILHKDAKWEEDWESAVVYQSLETGEVVVRKSSVFFDGRFEFVGKEEVLDGNLFKDVQEFHDKFELGYSGPARSLPPDLFDFRYKFMGEELSEYYLAHEAAYSETTVSPSYRDQAEYTHQLAKALDGLVDLVYVVLGTAVFHGFNFNEAWRRVHEANMKKVRTPTALSSKRGSIYDVVKPPGWEAPSLDDLTEVNDGRYPHTDRA
jgi:predicted HAD superfamily Cof-like phosphohydrolase